MNSANSIELLYKTVKEKHGKTVAKQTVKSILSNILDDLENEGTDVSEENISKRMMKKANDFIEASKSEVA